MAGKNNRGINSEGVEFVCEQLSRLGWLVSPFPKDSFLKKFQNQETGEQISLKIKASEHKHWSIGTAKFNGAQWNVEDINDDADFYIFVDLTENAGYIVPTHKLKKIVIHYAPVKYDKRKSKKGFSKKEQQPCWINATQKDHQDEWLEITKFKNQWDLLNVAGKFNPQIHTKFMSPKTVDDLKNCIKDEQNPDGKIDFGEFTYFLKKYRHLIHTGNLAEYYCKWLFGVELNSKNNTLGYDGTLNGKKVQIKQRGKVSSLETDPENYDLLYYVLLNDDLIPVKIERYESSDLKNWRDKAKHDGLLKYKNQKPRIIFKDINSELIFENK